MSNLLEWRRRRKNEWWLVYADAPPMPELRDEHGVAWPPLMSASTSAGSCWHLFSYSNGAMPEDESYRDDDVDYMHVCDLGQHLAQLTALLVQSESDQQGES